MKIAIFCSSILFILTSCFISEHEPTEKEKSAVFKAAKFENSVVHDQSAYTAMLKTIFEKFDSIVVDNRKRHYSKQLDSIFGLIHTEKLVVSKDKGNIVVRFDINRYRRENRVIECHFLYWHDDVNFENQESFDFFKDTILNRNYVYRIGVAKDNSGW